MININGIDVSEEIRYCNNCGNLGLDFKTGKFYCSLSNRKDELPEILSCENFSSNCYIKRLQKENEELKNKNNDLIEEIASGNIDIAILQKENEELHRHCQICENFIDGIPCKPLRDMDYDLQKVINQRDKYIQALEKIRKRVNKLIDSKGYAEVEEDRIIQLLDEVLNEK